MGEMLRISTFHPQITKRRDVWAAPDIVYGRVCKSHHAKAWCYFREMYASIINSPTPLYVKLALMNLIKSEFTYSSDIKSINHFEGSSRISEEFPDYLVDESRLSSNPVETIFFPDSISDVSAIMRDMHKRGLRVCVSGARTGVVGGAVALDVDCVISLGGMNEIIDFDKKSISAQCGVTLDILNEFISENIPEMFYPVDPTETTSSIGGNVASNASGARTYYYGATRNWVNAITVVLADGSILNLRRGDVIADGRLFRIQFPNQPEITFEFPHHKYPKVKNTAGFILTENMDAIDLFIGCEGILGIITKMDLRLIKKPANRLYTVIWTDTEKQAVDLVAAIRSSDILNMLAIEYFSPNAIEILKQRRLNDGSSSVIPRMPDDAIAAIFIDCVYKDDSELADISDELGAILHAQSLSLDNTWSGMNDSDLKRMKQLRHALPETINMIIAERKKDNPDIHKLSTDFAVPDDKLESMLNIYHQKLGDTGIEHVIFGHIGDNHLHLNMLPKSEKELNQAKELYVELTKEAVRLGGTIAAEHGIGRLKRHLMPVQYPPEMLNSMHELKNIFDTKGLLNPGVMLPD